MDHSNCVQSVIRIGLATATALLVVAALLVVLNGSLVSVRADPVLPPAGYPKFILSTTTVTPTLVGTAGATLTYRIEIVNSGAYTGEDTILTDFIPAGTTYNGDLSASAPFSLTVDGETLTWVGDVGFDASVVISFSVSVPAGISGTLRNTAVLSHPLTARPLTMTAETIVTDVPLLVVEKTSTPAVPGANKPLVYSLIVTNLGQPATNMPITVTDWVPFYTTLGAVGPDGAASPGGDVVTWTRSVTLGVGQSTVFTFSVDVGDVPSGTVITNDDYQVAGALSGVSAGEPYTVTVVDPIFVVFKEIWPDPPGSNREMTYTVTVLNVGSLATNLVVTDRLPAGVEYVRGGTLLSDVISWTLSSLDTGELAEFTFTVYISDVMNVAIGNRDYGVCSAEGVCQAGTVLTSVIRGPTFVATAALDPIAKKPGGGNAPTTPTLTIRNLGPGNALQATALIYFYQISVSGADFYVDPSVGVLNGPFDCDTSLLKCDYFVWVGDLFYGDVITFTTYEGQSTIGGPVPYTATVVITDSLSNMTTEPVTATAGGQVMQIANLVPTKSALPVIGPGYLMTYTIQVWNSGLSTGDPPPTLFDVVPMSMTVVRVSDGGMTQTVSGTTVVSWTLPAMSTGSELHRSFVVRIPTDLISGTQIVNEEYMAYWTNSGIVYSNTGEPLTTTVQEVGLIHSFKLVTPTTALPGSNVVLTYSLHIVNSSALTLENVSLYDLLPWQSTTYQRDAVASAGDVVSDIVSLQWSGDVAPFSSEVVTLSVWVDDGFRGVITNTAVISHAGLREEVVIEALAYVTEQPLLQITKQASPDPVENGGELLYTIRVVNLGQPATQLVITDAIPLDTVYVVDSVSGNGVLLDDYLRWVAPALEPGESRSYSFRVTVGSGRQVVNDRYGVTCVEGVTAHGAPVITRVGGGGNVYLPLVMRSF